MIRRLIFHIFIATVGSVSLARADTPVQKSLRDLPEDARLAFTEDWASGQVDPTKWYLLRKKWGNGNHGVTPENVRIAKDVIAGRRQNVLICEAHGDEYDGAIVGDAGKKTRVGGVIVSKPFFASGRFEVVMKIGSHTPSPGAPTNPAHPIGSVPAIWTYGYRWVQGDADRKDQFQSRHPLYNPNMRVHGMAANEYWSELDFPEFGKSGDFTRSLYNTFCQNRHDPNLFDTDMATDGNYHTLTTEWRTKLRPIEFVKDSQVIEHLGYWWVQDKAIPFDDYLGNPLKRLGKDRYAVYTGDRVTHWIDGQWIGENTTFVPAMAAQLNLGIWLPEWAGPAPWETSCVSVASIKIWQYDDPGDVRGVIVDDIQ